ncbi:MAG: glycoside hydrolase family 2 TIM barrel-domain containing protein [Akkermansiaceae bacterium]
MTIIQPPFLPSGRFRVGCNYWASHAGAHMWSDWQPDVVAADFAKLAEGELTLLRVFPLWPDFQPLHRLDGGEGNFHEYRFGEDPLPDTAIGQAGVAAEMLERFRFMADEAHRHGLQLIVGLVTGWMSGRLFTPPAFANLNVISDPEALRWQARFVKCFVEELRDHPAIVAWDLGNECNVMGRASAAEAWLWTHTIATAIHAADPSRPVVSGMHSLPADPRKAWSMRDQGELTDFLTTHPYPLWTPHCDQDPVNTIRQQLHSTAESLMTEGLGGKPCFAEETGSMGPFIVADELAPGFLRPALFSLWAHDCRAMLWWCAFDQNHLSKAPYDWIPVEQELGLHRSDRTPKPLVGTIRDFSRMIAGLPFSDLPPRLTEAVCILSNDQDQWAVAQNSFTLAKLAGADLTFQWAEDAIRDAEVYLLPCVSGARPVPRRRWKELMDRVEAGAVLYVSLDSGLLADLEPDFGIKVLTRSRRTETGSLKFADDSSTLPLAATFRLDLQATAATVLAVESDGNPAFTRLDHGKGSVFFLTAPLETTLAHSPGCYQGGPYANAWKLYARVFAAASNRRAWRKTTANIAVTEHPVDENNRIVVLINHGPSTLIEPLSLAESWSLADVLHGQHAPDAGIRIKPGDGAVLRLVRN